MNSLNCVHRASVQCSLQWYVDKGASHPDLDGGIAAIEGVWVVLAVVVRAQSKQRELTWNHLLAYAGLHLPNAVRQRFQSCEDQGLVTFVQHHVPGSQLLEVSLFDRV